MYVVAVGCCSFAIMFVVSCDDECVVLRVWWIWLVVVLYVRSSSIYSLISLVYSTTITKQQYETDLGERMPNEVFTNTLQFLNDYPSEVLVLLFEASSEQGPISWSDLYSEMANVDGFTDLLYVHTEGQAWPTMGELVSINKRIIVFYFNGGSCDNDVCPSEFHPWFTYAAETQFESASLNDLQDYEYSCQVTRGPGSTSDEKTQQASFLVVNNFVTPPDPDAAAVANSKDFLANRLAECANLSGKRPNFVYLDFWSEGVTAELVQYANAQYAEELSSGQ